MTRPNDESEFGGAPGMIQPPPHEPTAKEERMLVVGMDPSDPDLDEKEHRSKYGRVR